MCIRDRQSLCPKLQPWPPPCHAHLPEGPPARPMGRSGLDDAPPRERGQRGDGDSATRLRRSPR
eukprot:8676791-Pyramimonas_sp.AAC.1